MYLLNQFNPDTFLAEYWQKKPALLRGLIKHFDDPIDEHELAGLAQEEEVDARVISCQAGQWQLAQGPFVDFSEYCLGQWTLLVQAVDTFSQDADALRHAFDFIPYWRQNDLMVSFSNQGAGVGAHVDQYDVFIIQGKGRRHWQIGLPGEFEEILPHPHLRQIKTFEPIIDAILEPGDAIYIPPGHPHLGVALEDCMNYSIGFRAPTTNELLSSLTDHLLDTITDPPRYGDPQLTTRHHPAQIQSEEIVALKAQLMDAINSEYFDHFVAQFFSQHAHVESEQDDYTQEEIQTMLQQGTVFVPLPGIRPIWTEQRTTAEFTFYVQGERFSAPWSLRDQVIHLLSSTHWQQAEHLKTTQPTFFLQLLTTLTNSGVWVPLAP